MSKITAEHTDKLGTIIELDFYVVFPSGNSLCIGIVKKLNPKMIGISVILKRRNTACRRINKYPYDCVVIDKNKALMYVLKLENS